MDVAWFYFFSSVQSLSCVRLFATPWIAARRASLSITSSWSSLRLMSFESVMPSSHLILCRPLLLLPPIPPSIRVFSNESTLCMRWPKYWSFSLSIIPSKEIPGLISFRWPGWISLQSKGLSRVFSNTSNLDYKNQSHNLVTILQKKNKKPSYFPTDHRWSNFGLFKIYQKKKKKSLSAWNLQTKILSLLKRCKKSNADSESNSKRNFPKCFKQWQHSL